MRFDVQKNFAALNIAPLLKSCVEYLKLYKEITALETDYKILCEMAGEVETHVEISAENISKMTAEINRLRKKIAADDEKFYIGKCLDEVMAEIGYDVIGRRAVTKKSGKHFTSEIFSYGDGTAVNVTAADGGKIVMELCGLDEVDRTPNSAESEQLCRQMENFCKDFGEIERRLAEKGVIVRQRLQRLPPNAEYAQILNVNDYELCGAVEKLHTKRRKKISSHGSYIKVIDGTRNVLIVTFIIIAINFFPFFPESIGFELWDFICKLSGVVLITFVFMAFWYVR